MIKLIDSSFTRRKFHTLFCYPLCCLLLVAPSSLGGFPVLKWLYLFPSFPTWQEKSRIPRQILSFCNSECKNVLLLHDILDSNGTSNTSSTGNASWNLVKNQLFLLTLSMGRTWQISGRICLPFGENLSSGHIAKCDPRFSSWKKL